jgi:hypothetical protein
MNEVVAGFKTVNDLCLRVNMNISVVIFEPFLNKKTLCLTEPMWNSYTS